jgi:spermidine synthase
VTVFSEKSRSMRVALTSAVAGGATLAGEVLGARLLRPVVGSTALSQAGAVAGVLGGLGAGAWLASMRLARSVGDASGARSPRVLLERALLSLGALTLLAPWLARAFASPSARLIVALADAHPVLASILQLAVALTVTLPFGVLAGATYPCLAALHGAGAGRATAVSGAASSFGAAAMVLVTTFGLAPAIGVRDVLVVVAFAYGVAWLGARTFGDSVPPEVRDAIENAPAKRGKKKAKRAAAHPGDSAARSANGSLAAESTSVTRADPRLWAALAFVGVASTTWQLAASRLGVLAFGASAFALGAAVAAHTTALACGEATAATRADRLRAPRAMLAVVLALGALAVIAGTELGSGLPAWSASRFARGAPAIGALWVSAFGLLLVVVVPVVAPIGATIPLAARLVEDLGATRARANALVLGAMSIGNVAGALLVGLALLPTLTLVGAMLACSGCMAIAAILVAWPALRERPARFGYVALACAALAFGAVRVHRGWDVASLSRGPFLYTGAEDLDLGQIARIDYGREATVAVRHDQTGAVILQIDGKVDATSGGDTATQTLVGIVPAVLAPHPNDVLVIGLGSGMTVDAVRDVPGVRHVDVTELLPEVIAAARRDFRDANHAVLEAPNVRTLRQDASLFVRGTRRTYDVIVSEPSNPWVAGMADLFTLDALDAARQRLRPAGLMAAWFHTYSTDLETVTNVMTTFQRVFPHASLVEMVSGQDYMLLGMNEPIGVDVDRALARLSDPRVQRDLLACGIEDRGAFFGRFIAGSDGLRAMTRDGETLRADDLRLEFRAPSLLYNDASTEIFGLFTRAQDLPLAGLAPRGTQYTSIVEESEPTRDAALHTRQMVIAREARDLDVAIREGEQAVAANPRDVVVRTQLARIYLRRAGRRYRSHDPGGAEDDVRNATELNPGAAERFRAHVVLGDMALSRNDLRGAARAYGEALDIARVAHAEAPELHVRMADVLRALGDLSHARAELDRALRDCTDPRRIREIESMRERVGAELHATGRD